MLFVSSGLVSLVVYGFRWVLLDAFFSGCSLVVCLGFKWQSYESIFGFLRSGDFKSY